MEGDRKPSSSFAGEVARSPLFSDRASSPPPGFFSSLFHYPPSNGSKKASIPGLCSTTNRHETESQISNAQGVDSVAVRKPHGSPTGRQLTHKKDGMPLNLPEPIESPYFGSSVHYGARDFYASSPSSETSKSYKNDEGSDFGNPDFATRGEWWQGSLYY